MSTRDTLRSVRFKSIFQTAVSDFAVTDSALPAITPVATQSLNLPVTPLSAESPHSSPLNYSALAVSAWKVRHPLLCAPMNRLPEMASLPPGRRKSRCICVAGLKAKRAQRSR